MIAAELRYTPLACFSNRGTTSTTSSSFASFCMTSVVGPGIGSAMSNRSHCCDLQKYGALKSSFRQMICAPRAAASRTCTTARSTVAAASDDAESWMIPTVKGRLVIERLAATGSGGKLAPRQRALRDHTYYHIHHVGSRRAATEQRAGQVQRAIRVVPLECELAVAAGARDRVPRGGVRKRARGVGWAVAAVGAGGEQRDASRGISS